MPIYIVLMSIEKYWDSTEVVGAAVSVDVAKTIAQHNTEYPIDWEASAVIHPDNLHAYGIAHNGLIGAHYAIVETELTE